MHNTYRTQSPRTSICTQLTADLAASFPRITRTETDTTLTARIGNGGVLAVTTTVAVAWYAGDPDHGGTLLGISPTSGGLAPGDAEDVRLTLPLTDTAATVWVVADDPGTGVGQVLETNAQNNAIDTGFFLTTQPNAPPSVQAGPD